MNAEVRTGEVIALGSRVRRITAPNPGMMTGPGTNAYVVGNDELVLIDPGPEIDVHAELLAATVGDRLKWILCTHTHQDHSPGARRLAERTGARIGGMPPPGDGRQDMSFRPDRVLRDGETVAVAGCTLRAVHTPGHASNHLCYLLEEEKLLFTGDHIMQGSTVVITPPDGDMSAYLEALERLLGFDLARLAPGHGKVMEAPHDVVRGLVKHRLGREAKVAERLRSFGAPASVDDLVPRVYDDVSPKLHGVAARSLLAHLQRLAKLGRAAEREGKWQAL